MTTASNTVLAEGFHAPGPESFELPPVFGDVTKPMLLVVLSVIVVFGFFWLASRKAAVVPGRLQFAGEYAYNFSRNSITRDSIGSEHFRKFVPYITALFFFVLVNNLFGMVPLLQFPSFSRASFAYGLAILTWLLYNGAGIAKHGFGGYFKLQTIPGGVKGPILGLIVPLEFFSNILVRPFTLCLRLFANMFAGHLLLALFVLGGEYLIFESGKLVYAPVGVLSLVMALAVSFLELLVMFLQAYVFALLTAMYVGGALADEH
ncbi:F0F1 ATP synthase subunit A [Solicola gregarius]|uniref:ATP synthase subunit a n=1 Tax=Solicola gregarius TaxID=2908642 RepID=A0AA46YMR3_9ACTN|nr:F0F1 ATP synthase subunit A [Solicola gregarius]UYM05983.1 F0F1 ATP synthase subunit A [Solicola gregarius]